VAIAAMPTFSAQHALGKIDEMRNSLAASLRGVILLALPASVGLILLREPLISLLYQRREFDEQDVQLVAWALLWYAAGLVGHSVMEVLTRAFYAQQDTKTPVIIGTIAMGLNVVFSFAFARWFSQIGWMPHGGLALANSLATALEATALFIFMRRRLNGIEGHHIARGFRRAGSAGMESVYGSGPRLRGFGVGLSPGGVVQADSSMARDHRPEVPIKRNSVCCQESKTVIMARRAANPSPAGHPRFFQQEMETCL
jgi:putative peptidoglycan lipid II flippase